MRLGDLQGSCQMLHFPEGLESLAVGPWDASSWLKMALRAGLGRRARFTASKRKCRQLPNFPLSAL